MLYISILIIISLFITWYDILRKKRWKSLSFDFLLLILIVLCAFEYNVGSDDLGYRTNFNNINLNDIKDYISSLLKGETRYMPGWFLLSYSIKYIFDDYFFIKLIQAIFINCVVFKFIKEKTILPFTAIFLYAVFDYLLLSFNIVRQSFALAFFLLAFLSYDKGSLRRYYLYVTCAVMFHNTAFFLYLIPCFSLIKYSKRNVLVCLCIILAFMLYFLSSSSYILIIANFLGESSSDSFADMVNTYTYNYKDGIKSAAKYSLVFLLTFGFSLFLIVRAFLKDEKNRMVPFIFFYIVALLAQQILPILFRYRVYVDLFMISVFTNEIYKIIKQKDVGIKIGMLSFCITVFSYTTFMGYIKTVGYNEPYIYQYYPYTSIFSNKQYNRQ